MLGAKGVETHSKKTVVFVQQTIENSFFQKIHTHEGFVPVEGKGAKEREREREMKYDEKYCRFMPFHAVSCLAVNQSTSNEFNQQ